MVQTWNQCQEMLLTSKDKGESILLMETETGQTKSELALRRERAGWKLQVDSVTPMQKFEQYRQSKEYQLFGIGDDGHTVFGMNHDTRAGKNVEEFVIRADSSRNLRALDYAVLKTSVDPALTLLKHGRCRPDLTRSRAEPVSYTHLTLPTILLV